jgi:hypothetical protein
MPRFQESDAPEDLRTALRTLEARADNWFAAVSLSKRPWNCGMWPTLTKATDLAGGIRNLLEYKWLPEEGRDFEVRNECAVSNGVVAESEIFYAVGVAGLSISP